MVVSSVVSAERRQTLAGGVVVAVGILLLSIPFYDIWDDLSNLDWRLTATLLENLVFLLVAGGVTGGGLWLVQTDWRPHHVSHVAKWTVGGVIGTTALFLWVVGIQLWMLDRLKPFVIVLDGIVIGSSVTFGLGLISAKSNMREIELRKEQKARESLESLQETVGALQQTRTPTEAHEIGLDGVTAMLSPAAARIVVDGEVVRSRSDDGHAGDAETTTTASIGDRGRIELWAEEITAYDERVLELLSTHLDRALDRIERERNLEHERERLEFVNRFLRHNLLNGLNVVKARTDLLVDHIDSEARTHLEEVRERTTNMIDLIETLRSVISVISDAEARDLESVDLGHVLRQEIERAERAFEHAQFEVQGDPSQAGTVLADDLLGEVFAESLTNAVQHNEKDEPRITVGIERDAETIMVRIADNGPGIPEELRDRIFEEGEKNFESPGAEFGLYLVQELVDAYGGTVSIEENEPEGAVVSISLRRTDESE